MSQPHLPEDEPASIQWEGGEANVGDEADETRDKFSPPLDDDRGDAN